MLSERRALILKMIIDEFIDSASPVGSKLLINKYQIPFSSATIRNEMMALEQLGLLEKTHTSSGRVPSEEGYKFYIDNLIGGQAQHKSLVTPNAHDETNKMFEELVRICYQENSSFDKKIREILKVISKITEYTVFYVGPSLERTYVAQLRLMHISQNEALILLVTDVGKIETKIIEVNSLQEYILLEHIVKYLNEMIRGVSLATLNERLRDELGPVLSQHLVNYHRFHQELSDFFSSFIGSATYFSGQMNMLTDDNLENIKNMKNIFAFFEDEYAMQWFRGESPGVDVHIGEEIHNELFENQAVVRLTFNMPHQGYGTIGIIGPKRMHYNDVIQLLLFIRQFIDKGGSS